MEGQDWIPIEAKVKACVIFDSNGLEWRIDQKKNPFENLGSALGFASSPSILSDRRRPASLPLWTGARSAALLVVEGSRRLVAAEVDGEGVATEVSDSSLYSGSSFDDVLNAFHDALEAGKPYTPLGQQASTRRSKRERPTDSLHLDITVPLHDISKYATQDDPADWLIVRGQPRHLRPGGWVYIRTEAEIVGRVKSLGSGERESRPERTGPEEGDRGPGPVVYVDPATWELSPLYDLSVNRRFFGQGMRYVSTSEDGTLQHFAVATGLSYGEPLVPVDGGQHKSTNGNENLHGTTGDEAGAEGAILEGAVTTTTVVAYERSAKARRLCIEHYGYDCSVCELNFSDVYGELGRDFIHVHHLRELSSIGAEYEVDAVEDLRPICPNCHAMVHRRTPALTIEELKTVLQSQQGNQS